MSDDATLDEFANSKESEQGDNGRSLVQLGPKQLHIPEKWKISELEEYNHTEKPICYGVLKPGDDIENGTPLIKIEDIVDGNLTKKQDFHGITDDLDEEFSRSRLDGGELLISIQGSVGNVAVVPSELSGSNISRTIGRITPIEVNTLWVKYYLESKPVQDYIEVISSGSTRASYNIGDIRKTKLILPPKDEQRKIATVLHTVDQAIQKTEEVINQINRVKSGFLQQLFTEGYYDHERFRETRIGQLPESWGLSKLKDHTELISGAHVKSELVSDDESLAPYITGPDDFDEFGFTVSKYTDEPTKFCEPEDTLVTVKGSGCGKTTFADQRACISRQLKALRPKNTIEPLYLYYFLRTKQNLLETLAEGSAIPGLSNSHLTALDIPVPSIEEQREICETLRELDHLIEHEQEYKSQLNSLKHGLMQDLLSGTVRTTDTNIEVPDEIAQYG